ncbi:MAG: hypothetical protein WCO82_10935 [Sphingomonadales bacterium]
MRTLKLAIFSVLFAVICTGAQAGILGSTQPTIVVRHHPGAPLAAVYVIFAGSLSDMIVAEQAVTKLFEKTGVTVIGASSDISDVNQLQSHDVTKRVAERLAAFGKSIAILQIKVAKVEGSEATFSMTLSSVGIGEIAVGEVLIDKDKQLTIFENESQARRIAIRDATRRFVADDRIRAMFVR